MTTAFIYFQFDIISLFNTYFSAVLLKKSAGSEGDKVDVQKFFGYIGLFALLGLWWLGKRTNDLTFFLCKFANFGLGKILVIDIKLEMEIFDYIINLR